MIPEIVVEDEEPRMDPEVIQFQLQENVRKWIREILRPLNKAKFGQYQGEVTPKEVEDVAALTESELEIPLLVARLFDVKPLPYGVKKRPGRQTFNN